MKRDDYYIQQMISDFEASDGLYSLALTTIKMLPEEKNDPHTSSCSHIILLVTVTTKLSFLGFHQ